MCAEKESPAGMGISRAFATIPRSATELHRDGRGDGNRTRAEAGQRIRDLLDEIAELQRMIDASPAVTLEGAAVKLRRLEAYVERGQPARLLAGALGVLERAAG